MSTISCGFSLPASHVHGMSEDLENDIRRLIDAMTRYSRKMVEDNLDTILTLIRGRYSSGYFRDALQEHTAFDVDKDLPGLSGAKSRYWRIIAAHIHQHFASRHARISIEKIIREGGHSSITSALWDTVHEAGFYPTRGELTNIIDHVSKTPSQSAFMLPPTPLSYAYAGDKIIKNKRRDGRKVTLTIQAGTRQWHDLEFLLPHHLDVDSTVDVSSPSFYLTKENRLMMGYTVRVKAHEPRMGSTVLGCDLGRIKPITCSSVDENGVFSRELTSSRELDRLNLKLRRLSVNLDSVYRKKNTIERLLTHNDDPGLQASYEVLDEEYRNIRSKKSRLLHHLAFVSARDIVNHAVDEQCATIRLEHLSWLKSTGRKWNHAEVQSHVEHTAAKEGVRVEYVDAHGTSWEMPREYAENPAPRAEFNSKTRQLSDGEFSYDKDYAAAVAIACRMSRKRALKRGKNTRCRERQPVRCRDKACPTPKRPKRRSRYGHRPVLKKHASRYVPVGVSLAVGDDENRHQVGLNRDVGRGRMCPLMSSDP